jgi:hypothetical protein
MARGRDCSYAGRHENARRNVTLFFQKRLPRPDGIRPPLADSWCPHLRLRTCQSQIYGLSITGPNLREFLPGTVPGQLLRHGIGEFFSSPASLFFRYTQHGRRILQNTDVTLPDFENTAVDVVGLFTDEVDDQSSDILGTVDSHAGQVFLGTAPSGDRTNGVTGNTKFSHVSSYRPGKTGDTFLGGPIGCETLPAQTYMWRGIYDAAVTQRFHIRAGSAGGKKRAVKVGLHDDIPIIIRNLADVTGFSHYTGIVYQHIDVIVNIDGFSYNRRGVGLL